MPSLNRVELAGHLGKDVECRFSKAGKPVANFSLGVTSKSGKGDSAKEETYWANVVCFNKTAEAMAKVTKGTAVYVEGRITEDKWTDKEGKERRTTKVVAFHVWPLARTPKAEVQPDTGDAGQQASAATDAGDDSSDVPF
jgi:single-strand DNA-binding protein